MITFASHVTCRRFNLCARLPYSVGLIVFAGLLSLRAAAQTNYSETYTWSTLAGFPSSGTLDGVGNNAQFNDPWGVTVDKNGYVFVADSGNDTIREITPAGIVTTIAGFAGTAGAADGTNSAARFNFPLAIAVDAATNIYVADTGNYTIRKVTPVGNNWVVTTIAGMAGNPGTSDGTNGDARFGGPQGIAVDASNNVFVGDNVRTNIASGSLRMITQSGTNWITSTIVNNLLFCTGVAVDKAGVVYVADGARAGITHIITRAGTNWLVKAVTDTNGQIMYSSFISGGVAVDGASNIFLADYGNFDIEELTPSGANWVQSLLAGESSTIGSADGTGTNAQFYQPASLASDGAANIYVADSGNNSIRVVTTEGIVSTFAGSLGSGGSANGTGAAARFNNPWGIAIADSGLIYVADLFDSAIRRVTSAGVVSPVAGSPGNIGTNDGVGSNARFEYPDGVAVDTNGNIFVADNGNSTIREITPSGVVSTIAGLAGSPGASDGMGGAARFSGPSAIAVDRAGVIYVADSNQKALTYQPLLGITSIYEISGTGNYTIRRLAPVGTNWMVSTITGSPGNAGSADGTNNAALFTDPTGLAVDTNGNLYVTDGVYLGGAIREITPVSTISNGDTPVSFDLTAGPHQLIIRGKDPNVLLQGINILPYPGVDLPVTSAVVAAPFIVSSNYIYQPVQTGVTNGGRAAYNFTITNAGTYVIQSFVNAPGDSANSFYVNIDAEPQDPGMTWDIFPFTSGFDTRVVSWRGNGMDTNNQFIPKVFNLSQGAHQLIIRGREANVLLQNLAIIPYPSIYLPAISGTISSPFIVSNGYIYQPFQTTGVAAGGLATYNFAVTNAGSYVVQALVNAPGAGSNSLYVNVDAQPLDPGMIWDIQPYTLGFEQRDANWGGNGTNWVVTTIAGQYGTAAGIAVDDGGNLDVADAFDNLVLKLTLANGNWVVKTLGGLSGIRGSSDGVGEAALFDGPMGIVADRAGNVYVADTQNNTIRRGVFTGYEPANIVPYTPPPANASLTVITLPASVLGQWRFPWELDWHNSGEIVSNLTAGNYPIVFRNVPDYLPCPAVLDGTNEVTVTNNGLTSITNQYCPALPAEAGGGTASLTVNIPNSPGGTNGWRFVGETPWRQPGSTASGLLPDTYFIEFEPADCLGGNCWTPPAEQAVQMFGGETAVVTATYLLAASKPAGVLFPAPVPTNEIGDMTVFPFGFNGQLESDVGFGSGVAVQTNVVLTAAHLVFNDQTLSYVSNVWWSFQQETGVFQPQPMQARGWYVLSGYAEERTNDLESGLYTADQSSPQARNQDVAAVYFSSQVAGGACGGYLPSDAVPNPWLTGTSLKMLVGYPVDGSQFGDVIVPGKMYQTAPQPYPLSLAIDPISGQQEVYVAPWFLSYPGNSGGPLYVQLNGYYYPAGVYLGTLLSGTVPYGSAVRAIDSNVVNLITLAQTKGDNGTNNNGGGVITLVFGRGISPFTELQVQLGPPAALQAGGGWRLSGDGSYGSASSYTRLITSNNTAVEFANVSGWNTPAARTVQISPGIVNIILTNVNYTPVLEANAASGVGLVGAPGSVGTTYVIQYRTNLAVGQWLTLSTNTIASNGFNRLVTWPPTNRGAVFYRALPSP
jgi:hypothetical protein